MRERLILAGIVVNLIALAVLFYLVIDLRSQVSAQDTALNRQKQKAENVFGDMYRCIENPSTC